MTYINEIQASLKRTAQQDAFGRIRTSDPYTINANGTFLYDINPLNWLAKSVNGGSETWQANASSVLLEVTNSDTSRMVRQMRQYGSYQAGKSLEVQSTVVMIPDGITESNIVRRAGYFDDGRDKSVGPLGGDGVFFMTRGSQMYFVLRSFCSGTQVDLEIPQSEWTMDRMDGSSSEFNKSGIDLDPTKPQILVFEFEWLGEGSVWCGFVIDGNHYQAHRFDCANKQVFSGPYMRRASLPVRYEIENEGGTTSGASMVQVCSTIISEGGFNPRGFIRSIDKGVTTVTVSTTPYCILALRLAAAYNRALLRILSSSIAMTTNDNLLYQILVNPTISGTPTWSSAGAYSMAEYATDIGTNVNAATGIQIGSGYVTQAVRQINNLTVDDFAIGSDIAGNSDIAVLVVTSLGNNLDVVASVLFQEIHI